MMRKRANRAFTLTELLVVVAVVIILMSLLIVCVDGLYSYAVRLKCQHRMEQIWHACTMYAVNHAGLFPAPWDFDHSRPWYATLLANNYVDNPAAIECPSAGERATAYGTASALEHEDLVEEIKTVVAKSLDWYLAHQNGDGSWNNACAYDNYAPTAFACMSYMGFGVTPTTTDEFKVKYADSLKTGLEYIVNGQQGDGNWSGGRPNYARGAILMALVQAYNMDIEIPGLEDALKNGLDCHLEERDAFDDELFADYGHHFAGWEGSGPRPDSACAGWGYMAIALLKQAGVSLADTRTWESEDAKTDWAFDQMICINQVECECNTIRDVTLFVDGECPNCGAVDEYTHFPDEYHSTYHDLMRYGGPHGPDSDPSAGRITASNLACRLAMGHGLDPSPNPVGAPYTNPRNAKNQLNWLVNNDRHFGLMMPYGGTDTVEDMYFTYWASLALRQVGGDLWEQWEQAYVQPLINLQNDDGTFPRDYAGPFATAEGGWDYSTFLGCYTLEIALAEHIPQSLYYDHDPGEYSYGYNNLLGKDRRTPAADTIVLIDYMVSVIGGDDPASHIAPRHGGMANVMFADGHVEALTVDELTEEQENAEGQLEFQIKERMLSLQAGPDDDLPESPAP